MHYNSQPRVVMVVIEWINKAIARTFPSTRKFGFNIVGVDWFPIPTLHCLLGFLIARLVFVKLRNLCLWLLNSCSYCVLN